MSVICIDTLYRISFALWICVLFCFLKINVFFSSSLSVSQSISHHPNPIPGHGTHIGEGIGIGSNGCHRLFRIRDTRTNVCLNQIIINFVLIYFIKTIFYFPTNLFFSNNHRLKNVQQRTLLASSISGTFSAASWLSAKASVRVRQDPSASWSVRMLPEPKYKNRINKIKKSEKKIFRHKKNYQPTNSDHYPVHVFQSGCKGTTQCGEDHLYTPQIFFLLPGEKNLPIKKK